VAAPHLSGPLPFPVVEILKVFDGRARQHERVLVLCPDVYGAFPSSRRPIEPGAVFSLSRFDFGDPDTSPWELVWGPRIRGLRAEHFVDDITPGTAVNSGVLEINASGNVVFLKTDT